MCEYKLDASSDGTLMPIWMFKALLPLMNIVYLNKSINTKITLCAYKNPHIL